MGVCVAEMSAVLAIAGESTRLYWERCAAVFYGILTGLALVPRLEYLCAMTNLNSSAQPPSPEDLRARIETLAGDLGVVLEARGWCVATAESCTGGGIAAAITDVVGSSGWFEYGLVTYANRAKHDLLGVPEEILKREGAVSEPVVRQMTQGILKLSKAQLGVSVSGIAGPGGGTADKPVGTVWVCWGRRQGVDVELNAHCYHFPGDRAAVRGQTVVVALEQLLTLARKGL